MSLAAGLWAQAQEQAHRHEAARGAGLAHRFGFFSPSEIEVLRRFAAVLIPASGRSGGAASAKVEEYIDTVLQAAAPSLQRTWRRGLAKWSRAQKPEAVFDAAILNEFAPKSVEDQFFVLFKSALTAGFYTSQEGIEKELGYQGLGFLRDFRGWDGEEFKTPADYQPRLRARG